MLNNPLDNYLFWQSPSQPFLCAPEPHEESIDMSINNRNQRSRISEEEGTEFYLTVKPDQDLSENPDAMSIVDLRMRQDHAIVRNL